MKSTVSRRTRSKFTAPSSTALSSRAPRSAVLPQDSLLLNLPPELRNIIYRFAVTLDSWIIIDSSGKQEPGLLQACRQIRKEANEIYYQENKFRVAISNCDASVYSRWYTVSRLHARANYRLSLHGAPNWANLQKWLRLYFDRKANGYRRQQNGCVCHRAAVGQAFEVVKKLGKNGSAWSQIEDVLENVHTLLVLGDGAWARSVCR